MANWMTSTDKPLSLTWWARRPRRRYAVLGTVSEADLVPDRLPRKGVVLVANDSGPKWIAFDCPCRRRHRLLVPLSQSRHPHWTVDGSKHPSLRPSVDSHDSGDRCHFWLARGRIRWA